MLAANALGQTAERAITLPQGANNDYVGSPVCAGCHAEVYRSYRETDMGRSMALASETSQLEKVPASVDVRNQRLNRNFAVLSRDGAIYQSEYELDPSGAEVFRNTQKLAYVMGSGANAFSYVVQRGEYLFEAPLTYYSRILLAHPQMGPVARLRSGRYRIQPSDTGSMCLLPQRTAAGGSGQARTVPRSTIQGAGHRLRELSWSEAVARART